MLILSLCSENSKKMESFFIILIFVAVLSISYSANVRTAPLTEQIYYESRCPDSIRYITQKLYPTYNDLKSHLEIEFVPFGKASYSARNDGGFDFICQHGPQECLGNKYQACLLDRLQGQNSLQVEAINCIMGDQAPESATEKCMKNLGISGYDDVNNCALTIEGEKLLQKNGEKTKALTPQLTFVPWILYNNQWNEAIFEASLQDHKKTVCTKFLQDVPECSTYKK